MLQASLLSVEKVSARLSPIDSGMHFVVEFNTSGNDVRVAALATKQGLRVYPLSHYYLGDNTCKGLIIGYAYAATEHITQYGHMLAKIIQNALL